MKQLLFLIVPIVLLTVLYGCIEDPKMSDGEVIGAGLPLFEGATIKEDSTATTIKVKAIISSENGYKITERGFVYGRNTLPTIDRDTKLQDTNTGIGAYSLTIEGLANNQSYYVRPYAENFQGITYGTQIEVQTKEGIAWVSTLLFEETVRSSTAKVGGKVTKTGEGSIKRMGIYKIEKENNAVIDTIDYATTYPMRVLEEEEFFCQLSDLKPATRYNIVAFIENEFGTTVGDTLLLLTWNGIPAVGGIKEYVLGFTDITLTSTVANGGDETVFIDQKGFCWSDESVTNPDTTNNRVRCGAGFADIEGAIYELVSGKKYYVRAYAISDLGVIGYGEVAFFQTKKDVPTVISNEVTNISNGGAKVSGYIYDEGMSDIITAGICWSLTNPNPDVSTGSLLPLTIAGTGDFTGSLTQLTGSKTYYVRAYATNGQGTGYGEVEHFQTPPIFVINGSKPFTGDQRVGYSMAYFVLEGEPHILGGDLGKIYTDELYRYSFSDNEWKGRKSYPGGSMMWQSAVSYGNYLANSTFVYGGYNDSGDVKPRIYEYNSNTNVWKDYDGPDSAIVNRAIGYSFINNVFYIGGMSADTVREDVWSFDVPYKTWQRKADFPVKQYGGIAVVIDNIAYVGMGKDTNDVCNASLWTTDDNALTWNFKTTYPDAGEVKAGVACNDRIYIVDGGYYLVEYNPATDEWTKKSKLPDGRQFANCIFSIGSKIYVGLSEGMLTIYDPLWDN